MEEEEGQNEALKRNQQREGGGGDEKPLLNGGGRRRRRRRANNPGEMEQQQQQQQDRFNASSSSSSFLFECAKERTITKDCQKDEIIKGIPYTIDISVCPSDCRVFSYDCEDMDMDNAIFSRLFISWNDTIVRIQSTSLFSTKIMFFFPKYVRTFFVDFYMFYKQSISGRYQLSNTTHISNSPE